MAARSSSHEGRIERPNVPGEAAKNASCLIGLSPCVMRLNIPQVESCCCGKRLQIYSRAMKRTSALPFAGAGSGVVVRSRVLRVGWIHPMVR